MTRGSTVHNAETFFEIDKVQIGVNVLKKAKPRPVVIFKTGALLENLNDGSFFPLGKISDSHHA